MSLPVEGGAGASLAPPSCGPCESPFMGEETEAPNGKVTHREQQCWVGCHSGTKKFSSVKVTFSNSVPSFLLSTAHPWGQTTWAHIRAPAPILCVL